MWISPVQRLARGVSFGRAIGGWPVMEAELIYYRRRSAEEAAAAAAAPTAKVRQVHLELARRYDERVSDIEAGLRRSEIHLVSAA